MVPLTLKWSEVRDSSRKGKSFHTKQASNEFSAGAVMPLLIICVTKVELSCFRLAPATDHG